MTFDSSGVSTDSPILARPLDNSGIRVFIFSRIVLTDQTKMPLFQ